MNSTRTGFSLAALAAILLLLPAVPHSFAQDRDDQDPPARAGRISYTHGSVSFQPGGEGDWLDAVPNRPLTTGDNLWADRDARAEVQIGSTSIRLGAETSVTLLDVQSNVTQLRVSMGSLFFRVRHVGNDDTFEVDTPNLAFNMTEPGEYRIDVNENGDQTTATVWHGDAEITGGGSSYRLTEGQQGTFSGVDQLRYDVGEIGREDDFSRWCMDRDRQEDHIRSSQYVSAEMTGYEDLDEFGRWHYVPTYGYVWTPVGVPYGWAPYRYGHWIYVAPWGWTWVEDEPWGFAPFHYGRWAFAGGGWCWVPGPVAVVPVYSPALVAFVGGGGFSIGVGVGGGVGWFALAPGEVYVPWYRTSPHYVQYVNVTNTRVTNIQVTNVYNNVAVNHVTNVTYINQHVNNSVTVVNRQTFINAQPVHNNMIRVDAREIQRAPVTHEVVQNIQPQRQSVMGTARPVNYTPPQPVMARPVVATRQPVLVNRIAPVPGVSRVAAMPPIRTVEAAPRGHSELLRPGARGTTPGMANVPVSRPAPENNRGAAPTFGGPARPNMPENNPGRPTANPPRPATPQNVPMTPQRGEARNPRGPENYPGRPNAPEVNRPAAPQYNPPAAQTPENSRPMREVPRPPSARPEQPQNRPEQPQQARPAQPMPQQNPEPRRSNAPYARPSAPENRNEPQPMNPNYRPAPPEQRHEQPAPPEMRREPAPQPQAAQPEPPRSQEVRPVPAPEPRHEAAPAMRNEPAPRPPETHSAPPPQHESKPQSEKGGNQDRGKEKEKEAPKFR